MSDMLDGPLARVKGTTGALGAFLDSTLDRVGDAAVFSGLAVWLARRASAGLLAGVALYCLVAGDLVSYAKARAEGLGVCAATSGVAERSERLLIALVAAGPDRAGRAVCARHRALGAGGGAARSRSASGFWPCARRRPPRRSPPTGAGPAEEVAR